LGILDTPREGVPEGLLVLIILVEIGTGTGVKVDGPAEIEPLAGIEVPLGLAQSVSDLF
jgi:hypothetical protein